MSKKSWYRTWFDSPYYHILYQNRDKREAATFIDAILQELNPPGDAKFLDLACGNGRHSIFVNQKGFEVTGVDLSVNNIREAKNHESDTLHFDVHDMREPYLKGAFDFVLNLFTSFGYFQSKDENLNVLKSANFNLVRGGTLVIDFLNVDQVAKKLKSKEKLEFNGIVFEISRRVQNDLIEKHITVHDGCEKHQFVEKVAAFSKASFEKYLGLSGFEIVNTFGNYYLDPFDPSKSERLILIAKKINELA